MASPVKAAGTEMEPMGIVHAPQTRIELPYLRAVMINYNPHSLTAEKCTLVFTKIVGDPAFTEKEVKKCQELRTALENYHIATLKNGLETGFLPEAQTLSKMLQAFRTHYPDINIDNPNTKHTP